MAGLFGEIWFWAVVILLAIPAAAFLLVLVVNLVRKLSFREAWSASWDSAVYVFKSVADWLPWL